ncbi:MAG: hypothetical protein AUK44_00695 [Porphyromonadaceae bacterium CG2_30_38_12]|nr:MAG: hypothetical protein AUK44_00695 [Porphyromonadaceae bacterium CG2_30_38_12]
MFYKFLILFLFVSVTALWSQDLSKLTPEQLAMYNKYMAGKSSSAGKVATPNENVTTRQVAKDTTNKEVKSEEKLVSNLTIFGSYLFSQQNLTFEPQLNIPTPTNYILGTYDELIIDVSGLYEANYKLKVTPEGLVRIPNVGPVKVAGLTIESATRIVKSQIAKVYTGMESGETRVNISLGNIRSIRVTVIGEATRPGTYTLPSLATAFNALYACGGPGSIGTMRNIKVMRDGKVAAHLDIYRFLVDGVLENNISLRDNDVLLISPVIARASLRGAVKREGIFEIKKNETLSDLITFAGGYSDNAYKDKITNYRLTNTEKTVVDVLQNQVATYKIHTGDEFVVAKTLNRFDNRVVLIGAVFRPGDYAIESGLTLQKLLEKAGGVKEDAYLLKGFITRKKENQIPELLSFNIQKVLDGSQPVILLQKDDEVEIKSLFDYREKETVSIVGEVKAPGTFTLIDNITLKDLIFKANGFTEMAMTDSVELIRIIKDKQTLLTSKNKTTVQKFCIAKNLELKEDEGNIFLKNGDQVVVRRISGYEGVRMVKIEGEVIYPGAYNITNKGERISDLLKRSGGLTAYAYPQGAFLISKEKIDETQNKLNRIVQENSKKLLENQDNRSLDVNLLKASGATTIDGYKSLDSIKNNSSGIEVVDKIFQQEGAVGLDIKDIVRNPGGKYDFVLEEGDVIYVPRAQQKVRVVGQVLFPTIVRYDKSNKASDYVNFAGGFAKNADKSKLFVIYANGSARSTKSFLGIHTYPKVAPGARIVIPEKPMEITNKLSPAESIGILSSITSVTALIYSILSR